MKKNNNLDVAVVIPTLNEEEGIGPTLEELTKVLADPYYLVVDGQSRDRTVEIAMKLGATVITEEGKGKGRAVAQALQYVKTDTRYVVFTDADFTYPAEYIPKMIEILDQNKDVGMVCGNRFHERFVFKRSLRDVYYFGNRLISIIQYLFNGIRLRDPLTGLRIVRYNILQEWKPKSKGFDIEAELNHLVKKSGYRLMEVPIVYRRRLGKKKLGTRHGLSIFKRILIQGLVWLFKGKLIPKLKGKLR